MGGLRPRILGISAAAAMTPLLVHAASLLEEITVTAQKREQPLSDVGISVTAFSGEQLRELGLTSSTDLDNQTPGLIVTGFANSITVFSIRGSGQLDFNDTQEAPVAVYVDDVYISYLAGVGFNFYDLDRVEVLRGPQGTLFGRNATAGLVHVISKRPTSSPEGYVELTGGEFGEMKAEGAVSGPISENLSGRLSLYYEKNDGYVENLGQVNGDAYDVNNFSGRGQLLFTPTEKLSVLLSGRWSIDDTNTEAFHIVPSHYNDQGLIENANPQQHLEHCQTFFPQGVAVLGATNCFGYTDNDPFTVNNDYDTFFKRDQYGVTANVEYKFGNSSIVSITDWQDLKKRYQGDSDTSPDSLFHFFQDLDGNQMSQELRYSTEGDRYRFIGGLYYLNIDSDGRAGVDAFGAFSFGLDNLYSLETTSYAAFAQVEYELSETFTGIVGMRWTEDEKEFSFLPRCSFLPGLEGLTTANCGVFAPLVQGSPVPDLQRDEGDWSGSVELDWRPHDGLLVYGKVARGHKAGGVNGGIVGFFPASELTYDAETPITYELGAKTNFADGRAQLNASAFYIDYVDYQNFTSRQGIGLVVFNNDAEVLGSEIELTLNPANGLDLLFGVSLLDATALELPGAGGQFDRDMPNAPDLKFNALGRYQWPALGGNVAVQVDMTYVGERALEAENHPALMGDAYDLWNAHVEWRSLSDAFAVKLWVKNLTDEVYFPMAFDHTSNTGMTQHIVAPPRWFGATVSYSW